MFKYGGYILLLTICTTRLHGQVLHKSLQIGDRFPDYRFTAIAQDSSYEFTLREFENKNIIISLWDIYCSSCISGMQKLDSLQKVFEKDFQIILVTKNTKEQVDKLFKRRNFQRADLPLVVADSIVYDIFFPHNGVPLHIWIDTSRTIRYITSGYNTTINNMKKFLQNEPLPVALQSTINDYDASKPLIVEASGRLRYYTTAYSIFTRGLHNVINSCRIEFSRDSISGEPYSIKFINGSPLTLFQIAFNRRLYGLDLNMFRLIKNNRMILASGRAKSLVMPKVIESIDTWKDSNLCCYEFVIPSAKAGDFFTWMQQDLCRYFDLDVRIRKVKAPCLTLINSANKSVANPPAQNRNIAYRYKKRKQMARFIESLVYLTQDFHLPFMDKTSIDTNLSIPLPPEVKSIDELNRILKSNGVELVRRFEEVELLVIK